MLGHPETPPPFEILYVALFPVFWKGKEAPNKKNFWGQEALEGGGVWEGGFMPKFFMFVPFVAPE